MIFVTETEAFAKKTFEIAHKFKITYYDAAFLTLAKQYAKRKQNIKDSGSQRSILFREHLIFTHNMIISIIDILLMDRVTLEENS